MLEEAMKTDPAGFSPDTFERLTPEQRRSIFAATLGTIVEYTDWVVYAIFASAMAPKFFPASDALSSLLSTLAVFAVGFVMRPIGGALLGAYADRHGRKAGLSASIILMAAASIAVAICPTYGSIGILAPIILLCARVAQGLSAGGEAASATTFLVESAPPSRRAFAGSWQNCAIGIGVLLATGLGAALSSMTSESQMGDWGWRVGFFIAGLLGLISLWIRRSVQETQIFEKEEHAPRSLKQALSHLMSGHKRTQLKVIGIACAGNLLYYVWIVNYGNYIHLATNVPLRTSLTATSISIAISLVASPFIGMSADRFGRKPLLVIFGFGSALYAWPSLQLLHDDMSIGEIVALHTPALLLLTCFNATANTVIAELFPADVRASGIGFAYAISGALFGGTAPYVMTYLRGEGLGDYTWMYLSATCLVAGTVYLSMRETKGNRL